MDRISLLLLITCGALAHGLVQESAATRAPDSNAAPVSSVVEATDVSEVAELDGIDDALDEQSGGEMLADADSAIIDQILERFAVRHTALPLRERIRLAHAIVREAERHALEPDLVMAVIEVESAGYHLAESHVGAMGLMQLLPATAEELAGKLGIEWMGDDMLFDPVINVQLGTAYLRELSNRYDGNVSTALAAYNWGPGRIDRRIRRGATVPSLYIEQVMRAVDRYADVGTRTTRRS